MSVHRNYWFGGERPVEGATVYVKPSAPDVLGRSDMDQTTQAPEMDCYDAIVLVGTRPDEPSRLLAETARRVADLWNDPPNSMLESMEVRAAFPALADALDELLGGGPLSICVCEHARGLCHVHAGTTAATR